MATRLLIVGGVAGGASAAARARRMDESAEIIIFERGEHVSFANCGLPYYIGGEITTRDELFVSTPQFLRARFNIDVRISTEVISINRDAKTITTKNLATGETSDEPYDKLILSPGAEPLKPPLPGIGLDSVFTLRNVPDTDKIRSFVDEKSPSSAVVVGGGFIGLEMAENLANRGLDVTIIEMLPQVMPPIDPEMAAFVHAHLKAKGITLRLGEQVKGIAQNGSVTTVETSGGIIETGLVILSIGVKPENALALAAGLATGERGAIVTDEFMRTADPDIYAVGDAVQVTDFISGTPTVIPLAGPANRQGRLAADNALLGRARPYNGSQGTAIVRVFDLTVASTGHSEKLLVRRGAKYMKSYSVSESHASYYPGSTTMYIKLLLDPDDGKILGAQIVGRDGVDKRVDVFATAIRAGMTVFDLEELELSYAPPYSSAKDPVNVAGYIAANALRGDISLTHWDEVTKLDPEKFICLDVRTPPEVERTGMIVPNSVHIPLHDIRERIGELDPSKSYIVYCGIGLRAYVAHRILVQKGFSSSVLSGSITFFYTAKADGLI